MTAWRLLAEHGVGAAEGLALDEALLARYARDRRPGEAATLRLYSYRPHCALVGRYQNLEEEVDLGFCRAHGIEVGRRSTGGGAIIMGPGQLGIAVAAPSPSAMPPRAALRHFSEGVIAGLARLGIAAVFRSKNDLEVEGRKIAGLGLYLDPQGAMLFHSSVLVDLDVALMLQVLRIPGAKLSDKAIARVEERVTTVAKELGAASAENLEAAAVVDEIAAGFAAAFGCQLEPGEPDSEERSRFAELLTGRYRSEVWIHQRTPQRDARGSTLLKTPEGLVRIYVGVKGETIKSALFAGDFNLLPPAVPRLEAALRWCRADHERLQAVVAKTLARDDLGVEPVKVAAALWEATERARELQRESHPERLVGSCYFPEPVPGPAPEVQPHRQETEEVEVVIAEPSPPESAAEPQVSPEWVRISYASALALRFRSGRFTRPFEFGGINLLLSYQEGCRSDCGYCGLARSRRGAYEEKSFIRVEWPLVSTDELVERLARYETRLTRLCISMVTHGYAYRDTLDITRRIRRRVSTPLSILVAPPTLNEARLRELEEAGVDMIGIGLDAVTEELFRTLRTDVPKGGLRWDGYWRIVELAREIFGRWKVNCHTLVGLGESDRDLMATFERLLERQIFSYLFCFNPEPDSRLGTQPKCSITRWRRVQLAKFLLEECGLDPAAFDYDQEGQLQRIAAPAELVDRAVEQGYAFMTNGCPSAGGEPGCTRPMGSWRPSEAPRDFPWQPSAEDVAEVRSQLRLDEILRPVPAPRCPPERRAPPAAGRPVRA